MDYAALLQVNERITLEQGDPEVFEDLETDALYVIIKDASNIKEAIKKYYDWLEDSGLMDSLEGIHFNLGFAILDEKNNDLADEEVFEIIEPDNQLSTAINLASRTNNYLTD